MSEESYESPQEEIKKVIFDIANKEVLSHTIPLLHSTKKNALTSLGTGIFIKYDGKYFILTAAHVVKDVLIDRIYIPSVSGSVPLIGPIVTDISDEKDVAFIALDQPLAELLCYSFTPLSQEKIKTNIEDDPNYPYMMVGFPAKNVKRKDNILTYTSDKFLLLLSKEKLYARWSRNKEVNYILDMYGAITYDGKKSKFQQPHGMSGCGLWYIGYNKLNDRIQPFYYLVGIMNEIRHRPHLAFIGTKIKHLTKLIDYYLAEQYDKFTINRL